MWNTFLCLLTIWSSPLKTAHPISPFVIHCVVSLPVVCTVWILVPSDVQLAEIFFPSLCCLCAQLSISFALQKRLLLLLLWGPNWIFWPSFLSLFVKSRVCRCTGLFLCAQLWDAGLQVCLYAGASLFVCHDCGTAGKQGWGWDLVFLGWNKCALRRPWWSVFGSVCLSLPPEW